MEANEADEPQATYFEGLPSNLDIESWKQYLETFGHVRLLLLTATNTSGYALFEKRADAINAKDSLNGSFWPEGSETKISFDLEDNQEMQTLLHIEIPSSANKDIMLHPEEARSLFNVTKAEPPLFWSFAKE